MEGHTPSPADAGGRCRRWFAGPALAPPGGGSAGPAAALLGLAALLFFCRLNAPLLEPEEARYAEIPRQMLAEGRWLVPALHGQAYLDKPPLLYWLVMGCYAAFGVHDWAARLVPAAAAWLTVAVVYLWGRRAAGPRAALFAALVLALTPEFVYRGRMLTMNGLLGLTTTAALAAGWLALARPRPHTGWWLAAGVACGLGLLAKGPVALALTAVPLAAAGWLDPRVRRPGVLAWAGFLAAAGAVAGPWYAAVASVEPHFAGYFFLTHHLRRYVDSLDHAEPFWFYLPYLAAGAMPWLLVLGPAARQVSAGAGADRRPAVAAFGLLAAAWAVLFFSLADCKRAVYLLPAFPPLALGLGGLADALVPRGRWGDGWAAAWSYRTVLARRVTAGVLAVALAAALLGVHAGAGKPERLTVAAALLAGGLAAALACRRLPWGVAAAVTFAAMLAAAHDLLPGYHRKFSLRGPVREQAARDMSGPSVGVYCYPRRWDSVSFYLGRDNVKAFGVEDRAALMGELAARGRGVLFAKTAYLDDVVRDLPPELEFVATRRTAWVTTGEVRRRNAPPGLADRGGVRAAP